VAIPWMADDARSGTVAVAPDLGGYKEFVFDDAMISGH